MVTAAHPGQITALADSWELNLRAERKSPNTIDVYLSALRPPPGDRERVGGKRYEGAGSLAEYLEDHGHSRDVTAITRDQINGFIVHLADTRSPATALNRFKGMQQFFRWLEDEGEITESPMSRMSPPKMDEPEVPVVSIEDLSKLLVACAGKTFDDRRDTALIRFMFDTGARLSEVADLTVDDIDLKQYEVAHVRGKGGKHRSLPMGAKTLKAIDGYRRARSRHKNAELDALWLSRKGAMTGSGIRQMLKRRCKEAGIPVINPHQLRHSFSHYFLADGGQETDLMRLNGWTSRKMVARYASSAGEERAREAHRKHSPGDRL